MGNPPGGRMKERPPLRSLAEVLAFATEFSVAIWLMGYLGSYADKKMSTSPLFFLLGLLLAFIYGGYRLYRLVKFFNEE